MRRNARLAVAGVTTAALVVPLGLALAAQSATAAEPNLAAGKPATASSTVDVYGAGNVTDGNQGTYWESTNNQFPQWVQVDLGSAATVTDLTLKLPTGAWGTRTADHHRAGLHQRLDVQHPEEPGRLHVRPGPGQHRERRRHRHVRALRPAEHHGQHRLAGRAALRARGPRHVDPHADADHPDADPTTRPPARTSPSAGPSSRRRPSGPTPRPTPSTATSAPTGRAPAASTRATSR